MAMDAGGGPGVHGDHDVREPRGFPGEPAISPAVVTWHAASIFAKLYVAPRDRVVARVEERRGAAGDGGA